MIKDQTMQLGAAVTIAVRYAAVRRQGEITPKLVRFFNIEYTKFCKRTTFFMKSWSLHKILKFNLETKFEIFSGKEVQILDYQTQQYRIIPQLARTLAFLFAANEIRDLYLKVRSCLKKINK